MPRWGGKRLNGTSTPTEQPWMLTRSNNGRSECRDVVPPGPMWAQQTTVRKQQRKHDCRGWVAACFPPDIYFDFRGGKLEEVEKSRALGLKQQETTASEEVWTLPSWLNAPTHGSMMYQQLLVQICQYRVTVFWVRQATFWHVQHTRKHFLISSGRGAQVTDNVPICSASEERTSSSVLTLYCSSQLTLFVSVVFGKNIHHDQGCPNSTFSLQIW